MSSSTIAKFSIKLLRMEYESIGYTGLTFDQYLLRFNLKIDKKYGEDGWPNVETNELVEDDEVPKKYFGVTIKHDSVTNSHDMARQLLEHTTAIDRIDSKLIVVSGQKLKSFVITRKKYVKNMSKFKENDK